MKKIFLPLFVIMICIVKAQERKSCSQGILVTTLNDSIAFKDLSWDKNGKAHFLNARSKEMEDLYENSIKNISETAGNDPIFLRLADEISVSQDLPKAKDDGLYRSDYPEGIYTTKEDFIKKIPSKNQELSKKGLIGFTKDLVDDNATECFFYDSRSDKKLKDVFAVVYHGSLYFNIAAILTNRNKTDRAQTSDFPNSFVKVLFGGDNYIYTEVSLANAWAKGLAYNAGVAGGVIAGTLNTGKGVVWDYKNQEFNIFKNCQDYNEWYCQIEIDFDDNFKIYEF